MGKGCVSAILPDEEMPEIEEGPFKGTRADIIVNSLGVVNRKNPSQLYELEINFISDNISAKCKKYLTSNQEEKASKLLLKYLKIVNETQYNYIKKYYESVKNNKVKVTRFWNIIEPGNLRIHQPPFFGNLSFQGLIDLYTTFTWIKPYKFKNIENRILMGDVYYMLLRHHPKTKFSARSTSYLNIKNTPSKSISYKKNQQLYSKTPIRLGKSLPSILAIVYRNFSNCKEVLIN